MTACGNIWEDLLLFIVPDLQHTLSPSKNVLKHKIYNGYSTMLKPSKSTRWMQQHATAELCSTKMRLNSSFPLCKLRHSPLVIVHL